MIDEAGDFAELLSGANLGCRISSLRDFKPNRKIRDFKPTILSLTNET